MSSTLNTASTLTLATQQKVTGKQSRSSALAPFTARHSKALKNSLALQLEIDFSKTFHAGGIPLLVSPKLLRSRFMGQLDVARFRKNRDGSWIIEVGEVKSSETGTEMLLRGQRKRLLSAINFLAGIFGYSAKLILLKKDNSSIMTK